jgi:hypothetical protein
VAVLIYCPTCRSTGHTSHSLEACMVLLRERVDKLESDAFWMKRWIYEQAEANKLNGPLGIILRGPEWIIESREDRVNRASLISEKS